MTHATVTIAGNLTADPVLRFTQSGLPVCSFNVAHNERRLNLQTNEWEDIGETLFLRVNAWRAQGENIAASLRKGNAVLVIGRLISRPWEDSDGNKRDSLELDADIVSLDLRRQRAQEVQRIAQGNGPEPVQPAAPAASHAA